MRKPNKKEKIQPKSNNSNVFAKYFRNPCSQHYFILNINLIDRVGNTVMHKVLKHGGDLVESFLNLMLEMKLESYLLLLLTMKNNKGENPYQALTQKQKLEVGYKLFRISSQLNHTDRWAIICPAFRDIVEDGLTSITKHYELTKPNSSLKL